MKIDVNKIKKGTSEVPPECQAIIQKLKSCYQDNNNENLLQELQQTSSWTYGKCELFHWVDVLNIFDDILEHGAQRVAPGLWSLSADTYNKKSRDLLLEVLRFTTLLIEHSFSRHLYNSMEHLLVLMGSSNLEILNGVLNLLYMFSKRSNFIPRLNLESKSALLKYLMYLAESWGGRENGFSLASCCQEVLRPELRESATTLHFEYYDDTPNQKNKITTIHVENIDKINKSLASIMDELIETFQIPESQRMVLFTQLRLAHGFPDYNRRLLCVQARLQSISVLVYSNGLQDSTHQAVLYNGLLEELVELLGISSQDLVDIRAAALRTLTSVIHLDRNPHFPKKPGSRLSTIIDVTGAANYHGQLPVMVRTCIASLTGSQPHEQARVYGASIQSFPLPLATALFSFLYHLASYETGGEALVSCGMMESLLKVINWPGEDLDQITFVTRAVRVIDLITNIDMSAFQTHQGLASFINRLELEINICRKEQPFEIIIPGSHEKNADNEESVDPVESTSAQCSSQEGLSRTDSTTQTTDTLTTTNISTDTDTTGVDVNVSTTPTASVTETMSNTWLASASTSSTVDTSIVPIVSVTSTQTSDIVMEEQESVASSAGEPAKYDTAMDVDDNDAQESSSSSTTTNATVAPVIQELFHRVPKVKESIDYSGNRWQDAKTGKTCLPQRAALIKSILNFLKKAIQDQTFSESMRTVMEGSLPASLKHIISNSDYYGPSLFLLATDVVTVYIFQEPSLLSTLQDNHLTDVVLQALLVKEVPPTREVLASLPNVISALCLNARGLAHFRQCHSFDHLCEIFVHPLYMPAMRRRRSNEPLGDTASTLGNAMDELMRHHPDLKTQAMKAVINLLDEIYVYGTSPQYVCESYYTSKKTSSIPDPPPTNSNDGGGSSDEEEDEEKDTPSSSYYVRTENTHGKQTPIPLIDYIHNVMKFIDAILSNNSTEDHCKEFVALGGLKYVVKLLSMPNLPADYAVTPAAQAVANVCKSILSLAREPKVLEEGLKELKQVLVRLEPLTDHSSGKCVLLHELAMAPDLDNAINCFNATPLLHSMAAAHGFVIMFVHVCRTGQSDMRNTSVQTWGSQLGLEVLHKLSTLYTSLVWESTLLLALCSDDIIPADCDFGQEDLNLLTPQKEGRLLKTTTEAMNTMKVESPSDQTAETATTSSATPSPATSSKKTTRVAPHPDQLKHLKLLLGAASRLGRALAELFGLLIKLCVGSPKRRVTFQHHTVAYPTKGAKAVAQAMADLLARGLNWHLVPPAPLEKFKLTYLICSVGFTSPMLFDDKKQPYHMIMYYFMGEGETDSRPSGMTAFFDSMYHALNLNGSQSDTDGQTVFPEGTGEFLDAWLMLLEKMTNPKFILDSPNVFIQENKTENVAVLEFCPFKFLCQIHNMAFHAVMDMWERKPLEGYGFRMTDSMLCILRHILVGEKLLQDRFSENKDMKVHLTQYGDHVRGNNTTAQFATNSGVNNFPLAGLAGQRHFPINNESYISQLCDMGFARAAAIEALQRNQTIEMAINYLIETNEYQEVFDDMNLFQGIEQNLNEALAVTAREAQFLNDAMEIARVMANVRTGESSAASNTASSNTQDNSAVIATPAVTDAATTTSTVATTTRNAGAGTSSSSSSESETAAALATNVTTKPDAKSDRKWRCEMSEEERELEFINAIKLHRLPTETITYFTKKALFQCLQVLESLPETVYRVCDLLMVICDRNGYEWCENMLKILCTNIAEQIMFTFRKARETTMTRAKLQELITDANAKKISVRLHLLTLLFDDLRFLCVRSMMESSLLGCLVNLLSFYTNHAVLEDDGDTPITLTTPQWISPLLLLIDLYEKTAVYTHRMNELHKCCTGVWKWFQLKTGKWTLYSNQNNKIINQAYWSGAPGCRVTIGESRRKYEINFNTLSQINEDTSRGLPITMGLRRNSKEDFLMSPDMAGCTPEAEGASESIYNKAHSRTQQPIKELSGEYRELIIDACVQLLQIQVEPGTLHAAMRLTLRLTRDFKYAKLFAEKGGVEAILDLNRDSNFSGFTSLATLILRHIMEEPGTLRTAIERHLFQTIRARISTEIQPFFREILFLMRHSEAAICRDSELYLEIAKKVLRIAHVSEDDRLILKYSRNGASNDNMPIDKVSVDLIHTLLQQLVIPDDYLVKPKSEHQYTSTNTATGNSKDAFSIALQPTCLDFGSITFLSAKKLMDEKLIESESESEEKEGEEKKPKKLLSKSTILLILTDAVKSYVGFAKLITDYVYEATPNNPLLTEDMTAIRFILDKFVLLPALDKECVEIASEARLLLGAIGACNHSGAVQSALVVEVKNCIQRIVNAKYDDAKRKYSDVSSILSLISDMMTMCPPINWMSVVNNSVIKMKNNIAHFSNISKLFTRKGLINELARLPHNLDLSNPNFVHVMNSALKPLETLTRLANDNIHRTHLSDQKSTMRLNPIQRRNLTAISTGAGTDPTPTNSSGTTSANTIAQGEETNEDAENTENDLSAAAEILEPASDNAVSDDIAELNDMGLEDHNMDREHGRTATLRMDELTNPRVRTNVETDDLSNPELTSLQTALMQMTSEMVHGLITELQPSSQELTDPDDPDNVEEENFCDEQMEEDTTDADDIIGDRFNNDNEDNDEEFLIRASIFNRTDHLMNDLLLLPYPNSEINETIGTFQDIFHEDSTFRSEEPAVQNPPPIHHPLLVRRSREDSVPVRNARNRPRRYQFLQLNPRGSAPRPDLLQNLFLSRRHFRTLDYRSNSEHDEPPRNPGYRNSNFVLMENGFGMVTRPDEENIDLLDQSMGYYFGRHLTTNRQSVCYVRWASEMKILDADSAAMAATVLSHRLRPTLEHYREEEMKNKTQNSSTAMDVSSPPPADLKLETSEKLKSESDDASNPSLKQEVFGSHSDTTLHLPSADNLDSDEASLERPHAPNPIAALRADNEDMQDSRDSTSFNPESGSENSRERDSNSATELQTALLQQGITSANSNDMLDIPGSRSSTSSNELLDNTGTSCEGLDDTESNNASAPNLTSDSDSTHTSTLNETFSIQTSSGHGSDSMEDSQEERASDVASRENATPVPSEDQMSTFNEDTPTLTSDNQTDNESDSQVLNRAERLLASSSGELPSSRELFPDSHSDNAQNIADSDMPGNTTTEEETASPVALDPEEMIQLYPNGRATYRGITIPQGLDPSFLAALPFEMREEVFSNHLRQQSMQRAADAERETTSSATTDEVSPEFLAALPPNIQEEVLAQQRQERQRQAAAAANPNDPFDAATFFQNLPPSLRQSILTDIEESQISVLPPELAAEAQNLRREHDARNRQYFQDRERILSHSTLSSILRGPGGRGTRLAINAVPPTRPQWGFSPIDRNTDSSLAEIGSETVGRQLLDQEAVTTLLVLLFVQDLRLNINRLHRVIRYLCFHPPTRDFVIRTLISIMEKCNESRASPQSSVTHQTSPKRKMPRSVSGYSHTLSDSDVTLTTSKGSEPEPTWLNLSMDAALGCRANVFQVQLKRFGKRSLDNYFATSVSIHPQAAPIVFRNAMDLLYALTKVFQNEFLPKKAKDSQLTEDGSQKSLNITTTFWDNLVRLENLNSGKHSKKGKSTLKNQTSTPFYEVEPRPSSFDKSLMGHLVTMLTCPLIQGSTQLKDKLLHILNFISEAFNEWKEDDAVPITEEHLKIVVNVLTSNGCTENGLEQATHLLIRMSSCPNPTCDMILKLLIAGAQDVASLVKLHIEALLVELREANARAKSEADIEYENRERDRKGKIQDRFTKKSVIITAPSKVKGGFDIQLPSMQPLISKTSSQAFFLRILKVIIQIREFILIQRNTEINKQKKSKGKSSVNTPAARTDEESQPSNEATSTSPMTRSQPDSAPIISLFESNDEDGDDSSVMHIDLETGTICSEELRENSSDNTNQVENTRETNMDTNTTVIESALRTNFSDKPLDFEIFMDTDHESERTENKSGGKDKETSTPTLPPLTKQLQLDQLWITLSECLTELEKTPDHHAALILQPAVEAFFLVHSTAIDEYQDYPNPRLSSSLLISGITRRRTEDPAPIVSLFSPYLDFGVNDILERNGVQPSLLPTVPMNVPATNNPQPNQPSTSVRSGQLRSFGRIIAGYRHFIHGAIAGSSSQGDGDLESDTSSENTSSEQVPSSPLSLEDNPTSLAAFFKSTENSPLIDPFKFLRFAELHRAVLNQILRQSTTHLADGPFAILINFTRVLDFDVKRKYFRQELEKMDDSSRRGDETAVNVNRNHVFEESFRELHRKSPEEWKNKFYVVFESEEGQDAGGLLREWYMIISREIFNPDYALFTVSPGDRVTYTINPSSHCNPNHLLYFKFVGRLIAKAIHDSKYLECYFTRSFYKHILGIPVKYQDMESEDPEFYEGLVFLKKHKVSDVGNDLTFTTDVQEFGVTETRELKPNGANIPVTDENKMEYINLVCQMKMTGAIRKQLDAFLEGFYEIIPKYLISIFNEQELELLISGLPNIDIDDLKNNTEYNKYSRNSIQIIWFWRALREMDGQDQAKFLQFVTGTSKVPLQGFGALEGMNGIQKFQIHRDDRSTDRLPSAHTCFNQLDLPAYETYTKLKTNLLKAIHECSEGFGFA